MSTNEETYLHDGSGGERRWNIDDGGVGISFFHGIGDGPEDWEPEVLSSSFLGVDTTNHVGAIFDGLFGVESGGLSCSIESKRQTQNS